MNPMRAIREKCLDCTCQQPIEVKECAVKTCALYPFRMGKNPFRVPRVLTEEQKVVSIQSLAKARATKGGK